MDINIILNPVCPSLIPFLAFSPFISVLELSLSSILIAKMTPVLASRKPDPSSLPKSSSSNCNGACCVCIQRYLLDHLQAATRPPPPAKSEPDEFLFAIVTGIIYILDYLYRNIWVRLVGIYQTIPRLLKIDQTATHVSLNYYDPNSRINLKYKGCLYKTTSNARSIHSIRMDHRNHSSQDRPRQRAQRKPTLVYASMTKPFLHNNIHFNIKTNLRVPAIPPPHCQPEK